LKAPVDWAANVENGGRERCDVAAEAVRAVALGADLVDRLTVAIAVFLAQLDVAIAANEQLTSKVAFRNAECVDSHGLSTVVVSHPCADLIPDLRLLVHDLVMPWYVP